MASTREMTADPQHYVANLRRHVGSPARTTDRNVVVASSHGPQHPMVVVALTHSGNRGELHVVMHQIAQQVASLAHSFEFNQTLEDDVRGWRHVPAPLTVRSALKGSELTALTTTGFNVVINAMQETETVGPTLAIIPVAGAIAMMATAYRHHGHNKTENRKAMELISRVTRFPVHQAPDADCFTGAPDNGVYAGTVSSTRRRQMTTREIIKQ